MTEPKNYITEDTTIRGDLTTGSSVTVAGVLEGTLTAGGEVQVLPDAVVKGDISGSDVLVGGRVEGSVTTPGRLIIGASGEVVGDVTMRQLYIEEGGTLDGRCTMTAKRKAPSGPGIYIPPPGVVDPKYVQTPGAAPVEARPQPAPPPAPAPTPTPPRHKPSAELRRRLHAKSINSAAKPADEATPAPPAAPAAPEAPETAELGAERSAATLRRRLAARAGEEPSSQE